MKSLLVYSALLEYKKAPCVAILQKLRLFLNSELEASYLEDATRLTMLELNLLDDKLTEAERRLFVTFSSSKTALSTFVDSRMSLELKRKTKEDRELAYLYAHYLFSGEIKENSLYTLERILYLGVEQEIEKALSEGSKYVEQYLRARKLI